jgi:hypothetical protein
LIDPQRELTTVVLFRGKRFFTAFTFDGHLNGTRR